MSTRTLAARSAVARSTVTRIEAGQRRVRRSLLANLAYGLDPDNPRPTIDTLVAAAGTFLMPESPWSERMHHRRLDRAILAGRSVLPRKIAEPLALHRAASKAWSEAMAITDYDDPDALARMGELLDASRRLREQAGPALTVRIGGHEISAGFGL